MKPSITVTIAALFCFLPAQGKDQKEDQSSVAVAKQFKQLSKELQEIQETLWKELRAASTKEGEQKARERKQQAEAAWREKAFELLRRYPDRPEAFEIIVTSMSGAGSKMSELLTILRKHHLGNPNLDLMFGPLVYSKNMEGLAFLEEIVKQHPNRVMRGRAALGLGSDAKGSLEADQSEYRKPGPGLKEAERSVLQNRARKYLTLAEQEYADVTLRPDTSYRSVGEAARAELAGLENLPKLLIGKLAPDIEGQDLDGKTFKLSDYRGKVVALVFWASWCPPSMAMVPHERKLVERLKDKPFALVGVNGDPEAATAKVTMAQHQMRWRSFWSGPNGLIFGAWNISGLPTIYVLDHTGVIRFKGVRFEKLDQAVDQLLEEMNKK
jgi:thiol-disulfide isomerase/thioredoxin